MNELVKINYENSERPTVSGRELHQALQIGTKYSMWFDRMCEYGFIEGTDFFPLLGKSIGGRPGTDHQLTINMAKELCMIQRNDIGKQVRQYFLQVEAAWNSPEALMARALQFANDRLAMLTHQNAELTGTVAVQTQQIAELQPKASYYDLVLNCKDLISTSTIAKDYGKSARWMNGWLHDKGVQFKQGDIWLLYQKYAEKGYTSTKTHSYFGTDGEPHTKVHTYWTQKGRLFIYDLMKEDGFLPLIERGV
ncbi:MAG: phage antirepressor KilAC domain-containing protein [Ruminococcus flavefaciens]|nr:phage antirepressor KilAC domain-containing protein [Ruminococcus flavefaciens]